MVAQENGLTRLTASMIRGITKSGIVPPPIIASTSTMARPNPPPPPSVRLRPAMNIMRPVNPTPDATHAATSISGCSTRMPNAAIPKATSIA